MFFFFLGAREPHESQELERFSAALDTIQTRYPNMTLGQLSTLLHVGMTPQKTGENTSVSDIVAKNRQKYPTVARQLDLLGEGAGQVPGMGLIEKETDPNDRRNRWVGISEKGKTLIYELDLILAPQILEKSDSNTQSYT